MDGKTLAPEYISTKEARLLLGVSIDTLRSWDEQGKIDTIRTPSGFRKYNKQDVYNILGWTLPVTKKKKIAYCRVTSKNQQDDLERQVNFFRSNYPDYEVVSDIGSGINWKRKGLDTILELAFQGNIDTVMVAHRDRLCRFAFELLENIIKKGGGKLLVLDREEEKSPDQELADDVLSIIQVYSCRKNGRRKYVKDEKNKNVPKPNSEEDT